MHAVSSDNLADLAPPRTLDAVHALACPVDTHLDSLYLSRLGGFDFWKGDWKAHRRSAILWLMSKTSPRGRNQPLMYHVSGPDFLAGGYGGACFSAHALWENLIGVPFLDPWKHWVAHRRYVQKMVAASDGRMRLARSAAELRAIRAAGLCCAILSLEGAHMLGPRGVRSQALRLARLDSAAKAGAAYLTLNHFSHTDISQAGYASLNPWREKKGAGLTAFGRQVVERCIDAGLLVDLSHTSSQGILDACGICIRRNVPAFVSHGASRSVTRGVETRPSRHLDRALDDAAIRAIVQTGGCISVILAPYFLQHAYLADGTPDMDADLAFVVAYYEAFARQIAAMGIVEDPWKHLSFGSDFDGGISSVPTGMRSGADLPKLTQAMLDAGWPTQRIVDVYSGNFLRIWERVRP
ncbi:dipeptidase [Xanthomonas phaseoli]|uniref:Peptidase n=1 Tax=Xanthomonas phaseoli pv. dieffenbachiae TaxID=92828 RepID=A0A1V9GVL9_9XANT|nr:dipeptidase [Xanthomonas phaseoli]MBO9786940.1 dipeptidase [Xanthomonas phaseoli pv. dieffenbachiae]MBO9851742.1 dipeptidase [Xanthomonas phaseoli pv. dieffenbachiae]MBO9885200.1 dipeptidase [Xanthomonas phaseoli pv. dieffenbachiae]MBO9901748.1 dipeptidase [Xanthomonas phaseoli pv. dieffenbachiae]MBO9913719.1 dipeptidase [Xanthomonas phaseoli pv. dieffenbachiae]